jgi:hypothetical protein
VRGDESGDFTISVSNRDRTAPGGGDPIKLARDD